MSDNTRWLRGAFGRAKEDAGNLDSWMYLRGVREELERLMRAGVIACADIPAAPHIASVHSRERSCQSRKRQIVVMTDFDLRGVIAAMTLTGPRSAGSLQWSFEQVGGAPTRLEPPPTTLSDASSMSVAFEIFDRRDAGGAGG